MTVMERAGIMLGGVITGEKIKEVIYATGGLTTPGRVGQPTNTTNDPDWKEKNFTRAGRRMSFWESVKKPFLERELNRKQVMSVVEDALAQTNGNYEEFLKLLTLDDADYTRFMKFLYRNKLTPPTKKMNC